MDATKGRDRKVRVTMIRLADVLGLLGLLVTAMPFWHRGANGGKWYAAGVSICALAALMLLNTRSAGCGLRFRGKASLNLLFAGSPLCSACKRRDEGRTS